MKTNILLVTLFLSSIISTNAQVLYTDIIPDTTLNGVMDSTTFLRFDINHDNISDFEISLRTWFAWASPSCCASGCCDCTEGNIYSLDTNSKIGLVDTLYAGGPCRHLTVDSGFQINNNSLYWRSKGELEYSCSAIQIFCRQGKRFIPIKLYLNGNYYYGWIRIIYYTFYDMAISLSPNAPIFAGQTVIGISETENNSKLKSFQL